MTSIYNRTWGHQEQAAKQFTGGIWRRCSFCLSVSIRNNVSTCFNVHLDFTLSLRKSFRVDLLPYKLARKFWCMLPLCCHVVPQSHQMSTNLLEGLSVCVDNLVPLGSPFDAQRTKPTSTHAKPKVPQVVPERVPEVVSEGACLILFCLLHLGLLVSHVSNIDNFHFTATKNKRAQCIFQMY